MLGLGVNISRVDRRGGLVPVERTRAEHHFRGQPEPVFFVEQRIELERQRHLLRACFLATAATPGGTTTAGQGQKLDVATSINTPASKCCQVCWRQYAVEFVEQEGIVDVFIGDGVR